MTFNYTSGDQLTLNSGSYTGYYNITNGIVSTGKTQTSSSIKLQPLDSIDSQYIYDGNIFDRSASDVLVLPYNASSIVFAPNTNVNSVDINSRIVNLYNNYQYLYDQCLLNRNDLPLGYTSYATLTSVNGLSWKTPATTTSTPFSTFNNTLTSIVGMTTLRNIAPSKYNVLLYTTSTYFIFNSDFGDTTFTLVASSDKTDSISNLQFKSITSIVSDNKDNIFIADNTLKQILKVNVGSATNNSRVNTNNPNLVTVSGQIDSTQCMVYYKDELYVFIPTKNTIQVLDTQLIPKRKYINNKFFSINIPVDMQVDASTDNLLVLTSTGKILSIGTALISPTIYNLNVSTVGGETFTSIRTSFNNSDISYITTSKQVYKCSISKGFSQIGKFDWSKIPVSSITTLNCIDMQIIDTDSNYDYSLILTPNFILNCKETNTTLSILTNTTFTIHSLDHLIVKDEYFNNITLNNTIKKIMFNHKILASNIRGKFAFEYNSNKVKVLKDIRTISLSAYSTVDNLESPDMYFGVNELVSPQAFNRVFGYIHKVQGDLLSLLADETTNQKYSQTEVVGF